MNNGMRYSLPTSVEEALALASAGPDHSFIAGGTDLLVQRAQGTSRTQHLIDLSAISSLREIVFDDGRVTIGAGTTLETIVEHPELRERFPAIVEAARTIASPLVRTSATIGGNLLCENRCVYYDQSEFWRHALGYCLKCDGDVCIATGGTKNCYSVFIGDIAPVLICLGATVEIAVAGGHTTKSIESLYSGDGVQPRTLPPGAIITRIVIPVAEERRIFYRKLRPRASVDFTNLTLAVRRHDGALTAAASGVGPSPAVATIAETSEPELLVTMLQSRTRIIDNLPFKRSYRREMLRTLVLEAYTI